MWWLVLALRPPSGVCLFLYLSSQVIFANSSGDLRVGFGCQILFCVPV